MEIYIASHLVMDTTMGGLEHLLTDKMEYLTAEMRMTRERQQAGKEKLGVAMCVNQGKTDACEEGLRTAINIIQ
jgi:hypothetical protein